MAEDIGCSCKKRNRLADFEYALTTIKAKCPICGSTNALFLYETEPEVVAKHFVVKEKEKERFENLVLNLKKLWHGKKCKIVRCTKCDFCYAYPNIAGNAEFYNLIFTIPGPEKWRWDFEVTCNAIAEIIRNKQAKDTKLIEIGSGQGTFAKGISPSLIPKENMLCMEYSKSCKKIIESYGIKCETKDVRTMKDAKYKGYFSIVCMFQVLEHMDNLDKLFKAFNFLTEDKADFFISVPNEKMIEFQEIYGALLEVPPHHTGRWNKRAFEMLCRRHKLVLVEHKVEPCRRIPALRQFLIYKYQKRRYKEGSFPYKVSLIQSKILRRSLEYMLIMYYGIISLPLIAQLQANSQWVHLRKL